MRQLRTGLAVFALSLALIMTACSTDDDFDPDAPAAAPDESTDEDAADTEEVVDDEPTDDPEPEPTETEQELQELPDGALAYTVEAGDTLSTIAEQFGLTAVDLIEANDLTDPDTLSPGDELIIPAAADESDDGDTDDTDDTDDDGEDADEA